MTMAPNAAFVEGRCWRRSPCGPSRLRWAWHPSLALYALLLSSVVVLVACPEATRQPPSPTDDPRLAVLSYLLDLETSPRDDAHFLASGIPRRDPPDALLTAARQRFPMLHIQPFSSRAAIPQDPDLHLGGIDLIVGEALHVSTHQVLVHGAKAIGTVIPSSQWRFALDNRDAKWVISRVEPPPPPEDPRLEVMSSLIQNLAFPDATYHLSIGPGGPYPQSPLFALAQQRFPALTMELAPPRTTSRLTRHRTVRVSVGSVELLSPTQAHVFGSVHWSPRAAAGYRFVLQYDAPHQWRIVAKELGWVA